MNLKLFVSMLVATSICVIALPVRSDRRLQPLPFNTFIQKAKVSIANLPPSENRTRLDCILNKVMHPSEDDRYISPWMFNQSIGRRDAPHPSNLTHARDALENYRRLYSHSSPERLANALLRWEANAIWTPYYGIRRLQSTQGIALDPAILQLNNWIRAGQTGKINSLYYCYRPNLKYGGRWTERTQTFPSPRNNTNQCVFSNFSPMGVPRTYCCGETCYDWHGYWRLRK